MDYGFNSKQLREISEIIEEHHDLIIKMNTFANKSINVLASKVWFSNDMMYVLLQDGREIGVPLLWFPRLRKASKEQLNNWRFIGKGVGIIGKTWMKIFPYRHY